MADVVIREDNTDQFGSEFERAIARGLERVGILAERYAKEELSRPKPHRSKPTPRPNVDTGRLRNSITHAMDGNRAVVIGTNVEYGPHVELGTSRSPEYPFLRPAARDHAKEYRQILEAELRGGQ